MSAEATASAGRTIGYIFDAIINGLALRFVMPAPGPQKHPLSGFSLPGTWKNSRTKTISRGASVTFHCSPSLSLLTRFASVPPFCSTRCT